MQLTRYFGPGDVHLDVVADDKRALLGAAGRALAGSDLDADAVAVLLGTRERVASTGVGHGVAIPHASQDGLAQPRVALLRTRAPIAFDAVDGQPVQLAFAVLAPSGAAGTHLRLLARIARLVRSPAVRDALLEAQDGQAAYSALTHAETGGPR